MSLSAAEIAHVVEELAPLIGAIAQKAYCPERRAVLLELRKPRATHRLYLCAETDRTRIHLVSRRPTSPETPFAFQGLLRKEIVGSRLKSLHSTPGDRVVFLDFERRGLIRTLVAELTGRHGNLFLLNGDGVILGLAVDNLSSLRELFSGQPYVAPQKAQAGGQGSGSKTGPGETRRSARFKASSEPFGISRAIEAEYGTRDAEAHQLEQRRLVLTPLKRKRDRLQRTIAKVTAEAARGAAADSHRRHGDLLIRNQPRVKRGATVVRVTEYQLEGPRDIEIPLDPALSARENAERHFKLYRRLLRGAERARERLATLEQMRTKLDEEILRVQSAQPRELTRLSRAAGKRPPVPEKRKGETAGKPYREFRTGDGTRIWVGRSAADNDALTFRHARGGETWMHARHVTGAHVVVKSGDAQPSEETRLDAATLAAHFSDARAEPVVEITLSLAKHVHKPKGAPAGSVSVAEEKTLRVRIEKDRLDRLLATRVARS